MSLHTHAHARTHHSPGTVSSSRMSSTKNECADAAAAVKCHPPLSVSDRFPRNVLFPMGVRTGAEATSNTWLPHGAPRGKLKV